MPTSYNSAYGHHPHPTLLGLVLSTHRSNHLSPDAPTIFEFESAIAAISIAFFRTTVQIRQKQDAETDTDEAVAQKHRQAESIWLRWAFALLLAILAYTKQPYEVIAAAELFSYAAPYLWYRNDSLRNAKVDTAITTSKRLLLISASAVASLLLARCAASGLFSQCLRFLTPSPVARFLRYMFPVDELADAYRIMARFASNPEILRRQVSHLLFVTFHIQVGMGFLGIDFLRQEQGRRNELVRMDVVGSTTLEQASADAQQSNEIVGRRGVSNGSANGSKTPSASAEQKKENVQDVRMDRARRFQRTAPAFILWTALPYMFQIIAFGNINKFAFMCVQHDLHRSVRHNQLFERDNRLMAMAADSATSPEAYATSMGKVLDISYEIWNRKLFSLPKILLLPGVMSRQPMLVVHVFPVIFASDWVKAYVMSAMTRRVEDLEKELQDLRAVRSKVESFDIKNAELLQRSGRGAIWFTQRRWEGLTVQVQARIVVSDLINRSKLFFSFIQRNFVFSVLIDCALANLIAIGKIGSAETFVFSRAIEDTVDMLLMRSRAEAELARMGTEIDKLEQLAQAWERGEHRALLHCRLASPSSSADADNIAHGSSPSAQAHHRSRNTVILRNLVYSRGTAHVRADHIELDPGVYALTGSNGSGKSTLFRILMSCHTNDKPIDLPPSINLLTPMEPLCEEDDVRREITCEVDDDDEADVDAEAALPTVAESAIEIGTLGEMNTALGMTSSNRHRELTLSPPAPHPRLAITMPSRHVVEISQSFYWPLYSRPIDWIYQEEALEELSSNQLERKARLVAEELKSLEFFRSTAIVDIDETVDIEEAMTQRIISELLEVKEDWFSDLSGGQKSKMELVRKVFLHDRCPDVLLIDETMAPLDPSSKSLVMGKLKEFCGRSVVIVIYHTDVGRETTAGQGGGSVECIPSNDFFNKNIHLEAGVVHLRNVC